MSCATITATIAVRFARALSENGVLIEPVTAAVLSREVRAMIAPSRTPSDWRPWVPGDRLPRRAPDYAHGGREPSLLLYPRLSEQVWPLTLERPDLYSVSLDGVRHSPVMMLLGPKFVTPFNRFLQRLRRERIPARMSWLIEGYGSGSLGLREFLASIANWASESNKQFNEALEEVRHRHSEGINQVRLRLTADTWVEEGAEPAQAAARLRRQRGILLSLLEQWGQMSATDLTGEPALGVAASVPACLVSAPGPVNIAPLADALTLLPLTRPASLWETGLLLNTPDGKLFPFTMGSSQQASWSHFTFAGMGGRQERLGEHAGPDVPARPRAHAAAASDRHRHRPVLTRPGGSGARAAAAGAASSGALPPAACSQGRQHQPL